MREREKNDAKNDLKNGLTGMENEGIKNERAKNLPPVKVNYVS